MGGIIPAPTCTAHRFRDHAFEIAAMLSFLLVGLALLFVPGAAERSPVGRDLEGWTTAWALLYVLGCPLTLAALWRGVVSWRVAGLSLAGAGMAMQGTAAILLTGTHDPRAWTYWAFATACLLRSHAVAQLARRGVV